MTRQTRNTHHITLPETYFGRQSVTRATVTEHDNPHMLCFPKSWRYGKDIISELGTRTYVMLPESRTNFRGAFNHGTICFKKPLRGGFTEFGFCGFPKNEFRNFLKCRIPAAIQSVIFSPVNTGESKNITRSIPNPCAIAWMF